MGRLRNDPDDDDMEDAVLLEQPSKSTRPDDENEFDSLLAATMHESLESRRLVNKVSVDNMTIPLHLLGRSEQGPLRLSEDGGDAAESPDVDRSFAFKLLRKKGKSGNKVEVRELAVPESAPLARYSAKAAVRVLLPPGT